MSKLDGRKNYPELNGMNQADFIQQVKDRWEEGERFLSKTIDDAKLAQRALRGDIDAHWDEMALKARKTPGRERPTLIENLLPAFVNQVEGDFRLNTPSIKVVPESLDADPEIAEIIQGKIYWILYKSQAKAIHQNSFSQAVRSAFGTWALNTRYKSGASFEQEPYLRQLENFACRWDPEAVLPDLSDKRWFAYYRSMSEATAKARWPKANWSKGESPNGTQQALWWADKNVGVMEYWYKIERQEGKLYLLSDQSEVTEIEDADGNSLLPEGVTVEQERNTTRNEIYSCIINGNEIIEGPTLWKTTSEIPTFINLGETLVVDGEVKYQGLVRRDVVETQQLHNYHVTAVTETLALQPDAPWKGTPEEIKNNKDAWYGMDKVKFLEYEPDPRHNNGQGPTRESPPQLSQAQLMMPQYTKQSLRDTIGMQQASLGQQGNEKSGIAIRERKQEGDVGTFVFTSNFQRALEFEGRCLIEAIQALDYKAGKHVVMGIDGEQRMVEAKNDLDRGKYNLIVTIGPSMTTQRQEARQTMVELLQVAGQANPVGVAAVFPKLVKAMDMPDAHELAEIFAATLPPELQQRFYAEQKGNGQGNPINIPPELMQQVQQMQMQMQQTGQVVQQLQAENEQLKSKAAEKMAEIEAKRELSAAELELQREKIAGELALKQQEIQSKIDLQMQELRAKIEQDAQRLAFEMQLKAQQAIAPPAATAPVEREAPEEKNITVVVGGSKKVINLRTPEGKEYTGEVFES